jgi:hypothetical protein
MWLPHLLHFGIYLLLPLSENGLQVRERRESYAKSAKEEKKKTKI